MQNFGGERRAPEPGSVVLDEAGLLDLLHAIGEQGLAGIGNGVILVSSDHRVRSLNSIAESLTGWTTEEAQGRGLDEVFRLANQRALTRDDPLDDHSAQMEASLVARDGGERLIAYSVTRIGTDAAGNGLRFIVFHDMPHARDVAERLGYHAGHDSVTGLVNRQAFEAIVGQAIEHAKRQQKVHALIYLDVDNFKLINDSCGHAAGDELLRWIAAALVGQLRDADVLARLGGDEFGILLEGCPLPFAERIARAMVETVRDYRFVWDDRPFSVGATVGIVTIDGTSSGADRVIAAAEAACSTGKERGRNQVQVYRADHPHLVRRHDELDWVERISAALSEQRFVLFCQDATPLAASGGEGYREVLLRLRGESGAVALPGTFVPTAERYKLMPSIDRWVVQSFLRMQRQRAATPRAKGERFALNLSGTSINDEFFLDFVVREIIDSGVRPELLCFEITETAAIANFNWAGRFISVLRDLGCRFALDDFGTGVSSFAYLRKLPVDYIKIDGTFIKGLVVDPVQRVMVESIQRIGRLMGIQTVAEGVEDAGTFEALRGIGVDYAQGFHLHRPEPL